MHSNVKYSFLFMMLLLILMGGVSAADNQTADAMAVDADDSSTADVVAVASDDVQSLDSPSLDSNLTVTKEIKTDENKVNDVVGSTSGGEILKAPAQRDTLGANLANLNTDLTGSGSVTLTTNYDSSSRSAAINVARTEVTGSLGGTGGMITIDGTGAVGGLLRISNTVKFSNIKFVNCNAMNTYTSKTDYGTQNGGVAYVATGGSVTFENCIFENCHAYESGGVVFLQKTGSSATFKNCKFSNSYTDNGNGAVVGVEDTSSTSYGLVSVNMDNCSIIGANSKHAALYIKGRVAANIINSNFTDCTAFGNNDFGAILINGMSKASSAYIDNCNFINCHSTGSHAVGEIQLMPSGSVQVLNSKFIGCTADSRSILCVADIPCVVVDNCTFENNYADGSDKGASALYVVRCTNSVITDSKFINNTANKLNGGAIYVVGASSISTLSNCIFENNNVPGVGGAFYSEIAFNGLTFEKCNFTGNGASTGGAIYLLKGSSSISFDGCNFVNNKATGGHGGAIYLEEGSSNIYISDSNFTGNNAPSSYSGGAVCFMSSGSSIKVSKSNFDDNYAQTGGAIQFYASSSQTGFSDIEIVKSNFTGNDALRGGAIDIANAFDNLVANTGNGNSIYANASVTLDEIDLENGKIEFANDESTLSNSKLVGENVVLVDAGAIAHISNTDNTENSNGNYSVFNQGKLYLSGNKFENIILNNGTIMTPTTIYVLNNETVEVFNTSDVTLKAAIMDDNNNSIICLQADGFEFDDGQKFDCEDVGKYYYGNYVGAKQGVYKVSFKTEGLTNPNVKTGTIKVKVATQLDIDVTKQVDQGKLVEIEVKLNVPVGGGVPIGNVTFFVNGKAINKTIDNSGTAKLVLENLTKNDYIVSAVYAGDEIHFGSENETNFTVQLLNTTLDIHVKDVLTGQSTTAVITTNAAGNVTVRFNSKDYIVVIKDGVGELNLTGLTTGDYQVLVTYPGNDYYSFVQNTTNFTVYEFQIDSVEAYYNKPAIVNITLPEDVDCENLTVTLNGTAVTDITINGDGTATIKTPVLDKTNVDYELVVKYNEGKYPEKTISTTFSLNASDEYQFNVTAESRGYGNDTIITISAVSSIDEFNLTVDDVVYQFESRDSYYAVYLNGTYVGDAYITDAGDDVNVCNFTVSNLTVGSHTATISTDGNGYYAPKVNSTTFTVPKGNPYMNVSVMAYVLFKGIDNIYNSSYAALPDRSINITVYIGPDADGKAIITLDGVAHIVDVVDGNATYVYENATSGTHNVTFEYLGGDKYNATNVGVTGNFKVGMMEVNVTPANYGENAVINITLSSDITDNNVRLTILKDDGTYVVDDKLFYDVVWDGFDFEKTFDDGNIYVWSFVNAFDAGNYTVIVRTDNYDDEDLLVATANFTVDACDDYTFNMTVVPAEVFGNETVINVTVSPQIKEFNLTVDDLTYLFESKGSYYTVSLNGKSVAEIYPGSYVDGVPVYSFVLDNLTAGNHVANISFAGNESYVAKSNSTSFSIAKANATMNVTVNDTKVSESYVANSTLNITIDVGVNATGYVTLRINDYFDIYEVIDGKVNMSLENIQPGEYNVTAKYLGDNNYNASEEVTFNFTVKRYDIKIEDVDCLVLDDNTVLVNVVLNETDATGNVTIKVNGKEYNATVIDGNAVIYVSVSLPVDFYENIELVYSGDDRYNGASDSFDIETGKLNNLTIDVDVVPAKFGENTTVVVSIPLKLGDIEDHLTVEISNGTSVFKVDSDSFVVEYDYENNVTVVTMNVTGLAVGVHEVNVTYEDDDYNTTYNNGTQFEIVKDSDYVLNITVVPAKSFGNETVINVSAPRGMGEVNVTIGNVTYSVSIDKKTGLGQLKLNNITAGVTTAVVSFAGNENFTAKVNSTTFEIPKATPAMEISVNGTAPKKTYDANTTLNITVYVGVNATGFMKIKLGDATEIVEVINGTATLVAKNIQPGDYIINATYLGDSNYMVAGNDSVKFDVSTYKICVDNVAWEILDNNSVIFTVTLNETDATGNMTILIDGKEYNATVENGKATIYASHSIRQGEHVEYDIVYSGDGRYSNLEESYYNLTIGGLRNLTIDVNVVPAEWGENTTITVSVPEDVEEEKLTIYLDGSIYYYDDCTVVTEDGVTKLILNVTPAIGSHEVNVTLNADSKYNNTDTSGIKFNITQKDNYEFGVEITPAPFGENTTIVVTAPKDAEGVNVTVDDVTYNAVYNETSGKYEVVLNNLTAGNHNVVASVEGLENYTNKSDSKQITIPKAATNANVTVNGTAPGEDVTVTVSVGENTTGNVIVTVDGVDHIVKVGEDGNATYVINNAQPGKHNVTAQYLGDDNNNASEVSQLKEFTVDLFNITIKEINVTLNDDNSAAVKVVMNETANGNVTITTNNGQSITVPVVDGVAVADLESLGNPGSADITVTYLADDKFNTTTNVTKVELPKMTNATVSVDVVPAEHGENTTITVTVPDFEGNVIVIVDGVGYPVEIDENGVGVLNVTPTTGNHTLKVKLNNSDKYNDTVFDQDNFTVAPNSNFTADLKVVPAAYGENTTITVEVPADLKDNVTLTIDGKEYEIEINDEGIGVLNVTGIPAGDHEIVVSTGNENYTVKTNSTVFNIPKADANMTIETNGSTAGENVTVSVYVGVNATGNVAITIDGATVIVPVDEDGYAVYNITDAQPGKHNVTAKYFGDGNYSESDVTKTTEFEVGLFDVAIENVTVELADDNSAKVTVTFNESDVGGTVNVTDGNQTVTVPVVNGVAVADLESLGFNKTATITATFNGDDARYNKTNKSTTKELPLLTNGTVDVSVVPGAHGDNTTITINVPEDFDGNITVLVNGTPVDPEDIVKVGPGVYVVNVTPDVGPNEIEVKLTNSSKYADMENSTNVTIESNDNYPFDVVVDAKPYGENSTVTVAVPDELLNNDDVVITVDGKKVNATVVDGKLVANITGISAGNHEIVVTAGNENYTSKTNTTTLTVPKAVVEDVVVDVNGSTAGEDVIITVPVGPNATGSVVIAVDGVEHVVSVDENGTATYVIHNAQPGTHNVTAEYLGDNNYTKFGPTDLKEFEVGLFNVTIENVTVELADDNSAKVTIKFNESDVGGTVNVTDGNQTVTVPVVDGVAVADLESLGFNKTATITATYNGDDARYNKTNKSTTKELPLLTNGTVDVSVVPGQHGDNTTITINVPEDFDGNITVLVNGTPVDPEDIVKVGPGVYVVNVTPDVGPNEIEVKLTNSSKYADMENSTNVTIESQDEYVFDVTVEPASYGGNSTVTVAVPDELLNNDDVVITVDGKKVNATVVDGKLVANITGISAGNHEIVVTAGNENYTAKENRTTLTVPKAVVDDVVVDVNGSTAGDDVFITVPVGPNATGSVVITVDGVEHVVSVDENGTATYVIHNAQPGTHNVTAEYLGDNNYTKFDPTDLKEFEVDLFNITIKEINVTLDSDNSAVVKVVMNETANGNVTITTSNGQNQTVPVVDGVAIAEFASLGNPGSAEITVTYLADERYNKTTNVTSVDLPKMTNATVSVDVVPAEHGENTTITVTVPDFEGNVTVVIDGVEYPVEIDENGVGVLNVTPTTGNHTLKVKLNNSDKYNDTVFEQDNFTVPTTDNYDVEIDVEAGKFNENTTITVTVPEGIENVTVVIDGEEYLVEINETTGKGEFVINNLTAGNHTVVVKSPGNENYTAIDNTTVITVPQADPEMEVTVTDHVPGQDVAVTVNVGPNATGYVTIVVDGVEHTVPVDENGTATYVVPDAQPGNHTVTAKYLGDDNFKAAETPEVSTFTVDRFNATVSVNDTIIAPDNNVTVVVVVNETDAAGNVTITLPDGSSYTAPVENGVAEVNVGILTPDTTQNLNITYSGDARYNPAVNNTGSVEVPKLRNSTIDLEVVPGEYGENTTVTVTVPDDFDGNVTVVIDGVEYPVEIDENGIGVLNVTPNTGNHTVQVKLTNSSKYEDNETVLEAFEVPTTDNYEVEIDVEPGNYGENTTITVKVPAELKDNITVLVDGVPQIVEVDENGTAVLNISTLPAGDHEIVVVCDGDENYTAITNSTSFSVPQQTPEIEINITDSIDVGETVVVDVTLPKDATGYIYVNVNGTEYASPIENGHAKVEIPKLGNGTYDVKVTYSGDENYTAFNESKEITVSKVEENITAETSPITLGENAVINVTVPEDATGTVTVQIGDIVKTVAVAGGINEIIVPDVPVGDHEVIITYNGDDKYAAETTNTTLNVAPVDTKADDIKVEDTGNGTVKVTVPENATGNVTVVVDGVEYVVPVDENGTAVFNLTNLTDLNPGVHNVTIRYSGDENNTAVEFNTTVTIPKLSSEVSATAPTIREGDDAVISIEVDKEDAKGMVLVDIDGIGYYADVADGKATVTVPGLKEGTHNVSVTYLGDNNYTEATTETSIIVQSPIQIDVDGKGNNSSIVVDVPENATGNVTVLIDGEEYAAVVDANGTVTIPLENITPGEHNVTVIYKDSEGGESVVNSTITVPKWDATVSVKGLNILEGDDEILTIEVAPGVATGVVHVDIGGVGYYANITDGKATLTVKDLKKGTYPVKVRYLGDDVYDEAVNETTVTVSDALDIDVEGSGNSSEIVIEIPENKTGNITVLIDGEEYEAVVDANGTVSIPLENITPGEHNVTVIYKDSEGAESVVSSTINVPKWDAGIKAESENINVGDTEQITVTGPSDYNGDAVVNVNDINYHVYLTDGKGTLDIKDLPAGNYTALVTYMENDKYLEANTTTSFEVSKVDIKPNETGVDITNNDDGSITVEVTLPEDATGNITVNVDGVDYVFPAHGGVNNITIDNLTKGDHNVTVSYSGDDKYDPFAESENVTVTKKPIATVLVVDPVFTRLAVDYYAGERGGMFYGVLMDTDGNVLANKTVQIAVNGPIYNVTTDNAGMAGLMVNLMNANVYTYALFFQGDEDYNASHIASSKLTVTKKSTSITASNVKFKASAKKKVVKITLNTIKNPYDGKTYLKAGKKITLKVNGKTYTAKINKKGVAKFTVKLTQKGKYTAKIKFAGDKTYAASSKNIKITIK